MVMTFVPRIQNMLQSCTDWDHTPAAPHALQPAFFGENIFACTPSGAPSVQAVFSGKARKRSKSGLRNGMRRGLCLSDMMKNKRYLMAIVTAASCEVD